MSFIKYKLLAVMLSVSLVASMIAACSNSLNNDVQASELTTFKTYDQITKMLQSNMSKDNGTYGMWRNMLGAEKAAQAQLIWLRDLNAEMKIPRHQVRQTIIPKNKIFRSRAL
jgi:hypothetical protein